MACVLLSAAPAFVYGHAHSTAQLIAARSFMQFFTITSCGTAFGMSRIGAAMCPLEMPALVARGCADPVFELGAVAFRVAAAAVVLLGPETKERVLEEVSA